MWRASSLLALRGRMGQGFLLDSRVMAGSTLSRYYNGLLNVMKYSAVTAYVSSQEGSLLLLWGSCTQSVQLCVFCFTLRQPLDAHQFWTLCVPMQFEDWPDQPQPYPKTLSGEIFACTKETSDVSTSLFGCTSKR
jgi:hypothetical protein